MFLPSSYFGFGHMGQGFFKENASEEVILIEITSVNALLYMGKLFTDRKCGFWPVRGFVLVLLSI
jgi:hypothetical protein